MYSQNSSVVLKKLIKDRKKTARVVQNLDSSKPGEYRSWKGTNHNPKQYKPWTLQTLNIISQDFEICNILLFLDFYQHFLPQVNVTKVRVRVLDADDQVC